VFLGVVMGAAPGHAMVIAVDLGTTMAISTVTKNSAFGRRLDLLAFPRTDDGGLGLAVGCRYGRG
jgi:hypothetical protein